MSSGNVVHPFVACVVPGFAFLFVGLIVVGSLVVGPDTQDEIEQKRLRIAFVQSSQEEVANCLSRTTPWRCLQKMEIKDSAAPAPRGVSENRVRYLVRTVPAHDVMKFCKDTGEQNCAEKLVAFGYSNEQILRTMEN